tara:strand:+ start:13146 stop:13292 length:147 start_codon:yes stop_codon:yes gene_type:complete
MKSKIKIFRWNEVKHKTDIIVGKYDGSKIMTYDGTRFKIVKRKKKELV